MLGIATELSGNKEPVQISAERKTDCGPAGFRDAAEQGEPRNAHQQVGAHIRGLGAHGGDHGTKLPSAEVEIGAGVGALGVAVTDIDHSDQINQNGENNKDTVGWHVETLSFLCDRRNYIEKTAAYKSETGGFDLKKFKNTL